MLTGMHHLKITKEDKMSIKIYNVFGTDGIDPQEKVLFSAEVRSDEHKEMIPILYKMFACIPNIKTSTITDIVPSTDPHEYHLPDGLIAYAVMSHDYRQRNKTSTSDSNQVNR